MSGYAKAQNLTVDGPSATFGYRRIGPRGGVPLTLLNRFRGTLDWWDPQLLDRLSADHDVIAVDNVGVGYSTGEPRDTVEGFADGVAEFITALGLSHVDLLGWTLGGLVAQHVALRRPELVRRVVLAASNPGGRVPGTPPADERVHAILTGPEVSPQDMIYLFFANTETGRAAGEAHLARVAGRLIGGRPELAPAAARGQAAAIAASAAVPFDRLQHNLERIQHPVLVSAGLRDVMTPALSSFVLAQHLPNATLLGYGDAGHAFLFQHAEAFAAQVTTFLAN